MELKNTIHQLLETKGYFNMRILEVTEKLYKDINSSRVSRRKIATALEELQKDGKISILGSIIKNVENALTGKFQTTNYGKGKIVTTIGGKSVEYDVPARYVAGAGNNNLVEFVVEEFKDGVEYARIVKVRTSSNDLVYGTVKREKGELVFVADDNRFKSGVFLKQNELAELAVDKRCAANLINYNPNNPDQKPSLEITKKENVFGFIYSPMANIQSILNQHEIPNEMPRHVYQAAMSIPATVSKKDMEGRADYRDELTFTIDPKTAMDLDDEIGIKVKTVNGKKVYELKVAIADVSHYVKQGSVIDKEAKKRGTSIYPAGSVKPMLPEILSNGICSLHPNVDRLAMVVTMDVNQQGEVVRYNIEKGVLRSKIKFSYEQVQDIYDNVPEALEKFSEYKEKIDLLYELESKMTKYATKQGTLTLQGYQPTIILNSKKDQIIDFRNDNHVHSHKIIERAMVATNNVVATMLTKLGVPCSLRTHGFPDERKFENLVNQLSVFGLEMEPYPNNKAYQNIIDLAKEHEASKPIYNSIIRSMQKAEYSTDETIGHFALALNLYARFTSPIRSYSDLANHRIVKTALEKIEEATKLHNIDTQGKFTSQLIEPVMKVAKSSFSNISNKEDLDELNFHLNQREEKADEVSKLSDEVCAAIYMQKHLGKIKKGYVSSLEDIGAKITLSDPQDILHSDIIEVIVPYSELNLKINSRPKNALSLTNYQTGEKVIEIGNWVEVKIMASDPNSRIITATTDLTKELLLTEIISKDNGMELKK